MRCERIPLYAMTDNFDKDFGVDQWRGHNVFFRDGDKEFRTYLINGRGDEAMRTVWSYLDITPLGCQETWEDSPEVYPPSHRHMSGGMARQVRSRGRRAQREVVRYERWFLFPRRRTTKD